MKIHSIKIFLILNILFIFVFINGCAFFNTFKTIDAIDQDLERAYKYRDSNAGCINIGMSKQDVITAWGQPGHIYKPDIKNEYNHYSDEFWIYPNVTLKRVSYEVYFKDNKVIKIIELEWHEGFGKLDKSSKKKSQNKNKDQYLEWLNR